MKEIKISRSMSHTELSAAVDHNSRCDMIAIIDIAIAEALVPGHVPTLRALTRLKFAATKEDFQDYEGEHYLAEEAYEDRVVAIMEDFENNYAY
jgi:hypothetical protein